MQKRLIFSLFLISKKVEIEWTTEFTVYYHTPEEVLTSQKDETAARVRKRSAVSSSKQ